MAGDGVQHGTQSAMNEHASYVAGRFRARVVAWPAPSPDSGDGAYAVKVAGLGDAAASLGASARRAGLWVTPDGGNDVLLVSGPAAGLVAFCEHPAAPPGA
ncbi:MAG TPA: hypothetical protein VEZ44_02925, partial [bacterium]|nr:hypothetical protein [bacterium]